MDAVSAESERFHQPVLGQVHALRCVEDGQLRSACAGARPLPSKSLTPGSNGGMRLHGIVMLDRRVGLLDSDRGIRQFVHRVAARVCRRYPAEKWLRRIVLGEVRFEFNAWSPRRVFNADTSRGVLRLLRCLGHDDGDGLFGVMDDIIAEWHDGLNYRAREGRHHRLQQRYLRCVQMGYEAENPRRRLGCRRVQSRNLSPSDRAQHQGCMRQSGHPVLGRIGRRASDFESPIHPIQWRADAAIRSAIM
jgi:hypothetical protein